MTCLRRYGMLNLLFAAAYAYLGFALALSRSLAFNLALGTVIALLAAAGLGLLFDRRWGRWLGLIASGALLAFTATVIALLVVSMGYLEGIYGSMGKGLSLVVILIAALVFELCGLLPCFEIGMLLRDDVRRHFGARS